MKKVSANFQMLDHYVKDYEIKLKGKIDTNEVINLNYRVGYGIVKIEEKEEKKIGQVQMVFNIKLSKQNNEVGKISLTMEALFEGEKDISKEKFEEMLKINGAPVLSQIARAYIITNTSLNCMPIINLPMINFIEFFKNSEEKNN